MKLSQKVTHTFFLENFLNFLKLYPKIIRANLVTIYIILSLKIDIWKEAIGIIIIRYEYSWTSVRMVRKDILL